MRGTTFVFKTITKNISGIYFRIIVIYHPFIDSCLFERNRQQSMSDLRKDNNYLLYKKLQGDIADKYVSIFGNSQ